MKFENSLSLMRNGKKVKRKGWNGKEQFVTLGEVITLKDSTGLFNPFHEDAGNSVLIFHGNRGTQIWIPSQSDLISDDWEVVN